MSQGMTKSSKILQYVNYRMRITADDGRQFVGKFMAFDKHMNLVLGDAEEFRRLTVSLPPRGSNLHPALLLPPAKSPYPAITMPWVDPQRTRPESRPCRPKLPVRGPQGTRNGILGERETRGRDRAPPCISPHVGLLRLVESGHGALGARRKESPGCRSQVRGAAWGFLSLTRDPRRQVKGGKGEEREERRSLGLIIIRGESVVSLTVESKPAAEDKKKLAGGAAGPGVGTPAGRGLPVAPMGAAPAGLAGPARGVGGPGAAQMAPQVAS